MNVKITRATNRHHGSVRIVTLNGANVGRIEPTVTNNRRNRGWYVFSYADSVGPLQWQPTLDHAILWARAYDGWRITRWVEMSGLRGYLPDAVGCCETRDSAIASILDRFALSATGRKARELTRYGYVDLDNRRYGAEYAEVTQCVCEDCARVTLATTGEFEPICCNE